MPVVLPVRAFLKGDDDVLSYKRSKSAVPHQPRDDLPLNADDHYPFLMLKPRISDNAGNNCWLESGIEKWEQNYEKALRVTDLA